MPSTSAKGREEAAALMSQPASAVAFAEAAEHALRYSEAIHLDRTLGDQMICLFCKKEATFSFSGRFPEVGEFGTCNAHYDRGNALLKHSSVREIACLKVIRQEDIEDALAAE